VAATELSNRFAIVGLGMIVGPNDQYEPGRSSLMLEAEAARLAIEDAGLRREDVDGSVHVHGGPRSGRGMVEPADAYPRILGLPINFYYRCGRGGSWGTFGLATALSFLQIGAANHVVVAGSRTDWSRMQKAKQRGWYGQVQEAVPTGTWGRTFGETTASSMHSFFATRHMHEYGTTSDQLGAIAVQIRKWANLNPLARMYRKTMTLDDYRNSPVHIWPYHLPDLCVTTDGAIAYILTTMERARDLARPPVGVLGLGFGDAAGSLWWTNEIYTRLPVAKAKETAFGMAGIDLKDIDMAQFYDCFTAEVLFQLEDYGWCGKGEGGPFVEEGHLGPGGDLPTNTSGGLLSAYHMADLTGISEAVIQLRGEAGERQVVDAKVALVTGHGGELISPGMCSIHSTLLLGRA
jgi:acetyl-CoA acetyltransferase